ncbi:MAG: GNAT family N-acetyltransferase [Alphaproteobacteria bacterium]|nr:GNAT family N-acetyltransferase [Alphaproteobacteria bacterium]
MRDSSSIRLVTTGFDRAAWQTAASSFLDKSLMQEWAFGDAKAAIEPWSPERGLFFKGGEIVGVMQAMIRHLPLIGGGLVWINRGPLWRKTPSEPSERLVELLQLLRERWVSGGYYLCIAPPIEDAFTAQGFTPTGNPGWASARVDLSQSLETLRARLEQKWRNALNKAERGELKIVGDADAFPTFLDGYIRFLTERNFQTSVTPDFIRHLQNALSAENRLTAHIACTNNALAGGALIIRYGNTAEYLAGFATEAGHGLNVGQILLWHALLAAKDSGVRWFDVGGMDKKRTPQGIYHFKAGLGGAPYRLAGEIEACPTDLRARLVRWRVRNARERTRP